MLSPGVLHGVLQLDCSTEFMQFAGVSQLTSYPFMVSEDGLNQVSSLPYQGSKVPPYLLCVVRTSVSSPHKFHLLNVFISIEINSNDITTVPFPSMDLPALKVVSLVHLNPGLYSVYRRDTITGEAAILS